MVTVRNTGGRTADSVLVILKTECGDYGLGIMPSSIAPGDSAVVETETFSGCSDVILGTRFQYDN